MARRSLMMNEYLEMVYQWHQGRSDREISHSLQIARKTIRKYLNRLSEKGLSRDKPLPAHSELVSLVACVGKPFLFARPSPEVLEPYHEQVEAWLKEPDMTLQQVLRLLGENFQVKTSYMSLYRYVARHFERDPKPATVRLHTEPAEQAQVDFGFAGCLVDPETGRHRRAWAFIMILSYSRHRFVRFVFSLDQEMWLDCHVRAFQFFQGVVKSVVLDNLRDGVVKVDLYDPTIHRACAELERHFAFVADPAKVRMHRHKGKVERQVPVVRQQLLAGRTFRDIDEANERALVWCRDEIGQREHGTTHRKPYPVFLEEEAQALLPLPREPFERPTWQAAKVHPDCHLVFQKSYYSVPYRYRGQEVWVRADAKLVRIYLDHELLKTHCRAHRSGSWQTDMGDYPPEKVAFLEKTPAYCRQKAQELGPQVHEYIQKILAPHALRNLRKAQGVLRLADKYGAPILDQACCRALAFGNLRYQALKNIVEKGLWKEAAAPPRPASGTAGYRFARPATYFLETGKELP